MNKEFGREIRMYEGKAYGCEVSKYNGTPYDWIEVGEDYSGARYCAIPCT